MLHVGIAGARRRRALAPATLVVGTEARYCDLQRVPAEWAPHVVRPAPALLAAARRLLPDALALPIGTSARVGGTGSADDDDGAPCDVEAMEGFAVLRAAERAGVPALEVRAVSNDIEERDRARWHFDRAFAAITGVTPSLVAELASCVR